MDLGLQGRVAMITGGSHGLGKQSAAALGREGCKVAICARGAEQLEEARAELAGAGIEVIAVQADVTSQDDRAYSSTMRLDPRLARWTFW